MGIDYGTLTGAKGQAGSIRAWINYELIDAEGVLLDAQAYIYGRLRTREMRSVAALTIPTGQASLALPDGFLDPIRFVYASGEEIEPVDEGELLVSRPKNDDGSFVTGMPLAYSIWDEALQFDLQADANYAAQLLFFKRPAWLSRLTPTNFLTSRYPNLLRVACLMHGADAMQDDGLAARWKQRTDELLAAAAIENDFALRGRIYSTSGE